MVSSLDQRANSFIGAKQKGEEESHRFVGYHIIEVFVFYGPSGHRFMRLLIKPLFRTMEWLVYMWRRLLTKSFVISYFERIMHASIDPSSPSIAREHISPRLKPSIFLIEIRVLRRFIFLVNFLTLFVHTSPLFFEFVEIRKGVVVLWAGVRGILSVPTVSAVPRSFLESEHITIVSLFIVVFLLFCVPASPLLFFFGIAMCVCSKSFVFFCVLMISIFSLVKVLRVIVISLALSFVPLSRLPVVLGVICVKPGVMLVKIIFGFKVTVKVSRIPPTLRFSLLLICRSKWIVSSCVRSLRVPRAAIVRALSSLLPWILSFCPQSIVLLLGVFVFEHFVSVIHTFELLLCLRGIASLLFVRVILLSQLVVCFF